MRGKPLYGYAAVAVVGLTLMLVLSFVGVNQKDARLALEGGEGGQPAQETVDTTDPMALGEQTYKTTCIGCHGGNFDGPMGNLQGLADRHTKEDIVNIILQGGGTDYPGMPAGLVDAEKAAAIAEYLLEATK
ncbi:cytochrome c [Anaerobacillus alkaliphilus]|uniref:Cytochrome c n=1 Tax=Anaerobacillus alkaliphilus TaxID=1548597 RepID=A0A4Q0VQS3_9BACI|nr:cytochrome c [Anaerobacillus alkaliphilus]RXI99417.1 cytochrome c [Anaerobacillus alkaliphilus]